MNLATRTKADRDQSSSADTLPTSAPSANLYKSIRLRVCVSAEQERELEGRFSALAHCSVSILHPCPTATIRPHACSVLVSMDSISSKGTDRTPRTGAVYQQRNPQDTRCKKQALRCCPRFSIRGLGWSRTQVTLKACRLQPYVRTGRVALLETEVLVRVYQPHVASTVLSCSWHRCARSMTYEW